MRMKSLVFLAGLIPMPGFADFCEDRAAVGLAELEPALRAGDDTARVVARDVLVRVCRAGQGMVESPPHAGAPTHDGSGDPVATTPARDERSGAAQASETNGTRLLGIEFRKADADAPGQDRVRKRP